jgi:hypothetical protein
MMPKKLQGNIDPDNNLILHPTPTPLFYDMPHRILEKEEPLNRANFD